MLKFKLTTVGSTKGFALKKQAKAKLGVEKGDSLYLTEAADGGLRITPYHLDVQKQMALAEQIMHDNREILRALAE